MALLVVLLFLPSCPAAPPDRPDDGIQIASADPLPVTLSYKPGVKIECIDSEEDLEKLKTIAIQALDDGLHDQIRHLFLVWMKESHGQPHRAQFGASTAITAWLEVRKSMEAFEPPICKK